MSIAIKEDFFGETKNLLTGNLENVKRYTFSNQNGMSVAVITLGATVTSIKVRNTAGLFEDVVMGFNDIAGYQSKTNPYLGATIGRVANRIANGKFLLDGKNVQITRNWNEKHHLHGGLIGFDKVNWDAKVVDDKLIMSHVSSDGHEGYPGELQAKVMYQLTDNNCLNIHFSAIASKPTPVNMTNHSYFNLAGHDAGKDELYEHVVIINSERYTVTDSDSIPTGQLRDVGGTEYDFRHPCKLGEKIKKLSTLGFDDNFCFSLKNPPSLTLISSVYHPKSGRKMEIFTDQPGVQFYTSNYFPDPEKGETPLIGKNGAKYWKHGAFCLETQNYPDAVNHTNFPSSILIPGECYSHKVSYKFGLKEC